MQTRRTPVPDGTYFFTLALQDRSKALLTDHIQALRSAFRDVRARHRFDIAAIVILPDHLHCIWHLPPGDHRYPLRWQLIRDAFTRRLPDGGSIRLSRYLRREQPVWQHDRSHLIANHDELRHYLERIHDEPVRHGHVGNACDWPYSSIHRHIRAGGVDPAQAQLREKSP